MRIAIAEIAQESDTFSPMTADRSDFETYGLYFGAEILDRMIGVGPLGGFLDVVAEQNRSVELIPIVRAWAAAGGVITQPTLEMLVGKLVDGLRAAGSLDAVFLSLHGAAAAEHDDDAEGLVLSAARDVVGNETPIICPLDHHANITQRMVDCADALIGHETQPHDPRATGRKAARVLFRALDGEIRPAIGWRKIPMLTPQDQFLTSSGPMKEWFDLARAMEQRPGVIDVSPYPMQPWLDVREGGWSVVAHTDGDAELADQLAAELADAAWSRRDRFWIHERVPAAKAVAMANDAPQGLVILSDTGDSVYGGAPGDSTIILRELLNQPSDQVALVPVIDSEAIELARRAGVGATIAIEVGGKVDRVFSKPVKLTARVAALSDGVTVELPDRGSCDMRRTALLTIGSVRLVLLDPRSFAINHPVLYTHLGLSIENAKLVVVKTASNFQFFKPWRQELIRVDSAGMTQSNLRDFKWSRVPRPIYPLDDYDAPHELESEQQRPP